jgi:hypothetical protein
MSLVPALLMAVDAVLAALERNEPNLEKADLQAGSSGSSGDLQ